MRRCSTAAAAAAAADDCRSARDGPGGAAAAGRLWCVSRRAAWRGAPWHAP